MGNNQSLGGNKANNDNQSSESVMENPTTAFFCWNDNTDKHINDEENHVYTPFEIEDYYQYFINKLKKKEITLEKYIIHKNKLLSLKENNTLKRRLIEKSTSEMKNVYRPERFNFSADMFHHNKIDIFNMSKPDKHFVDISNKIFSILEFKVIKDVIIPVKIPLHSISIFTQDILDMSFENFKANLIHEIEEMAVKLKKENLYKQELEKITPQNFFQKIVYIYTTEGFLYSQINNALKQSNFQDHEFDINEDEKEYALTEFNICDSMRFPFNKKPHQKNNKHKTSLNGNKSNQHKSLFEKNSSKRIEYKSMVQKALNEAIAEENSFVLIENNEKIDMLKTKINIKLYEEEEEKQNQEDKIMQEKKEEMENNINFKSLSEKIIEENKNCKDNDNNKNNNINNINEINNYEAEEIILKKSLLNDHSDNQKDEAGAKEEESKHNPDEEAGSAMDKIAEEINQSASDKEIKIRKNRKLLNVENDLKNIRYFYLSLSAAINNFALDKSNTLNTTNPIENEKDKLSYDKNENTFYKFNYITKEELENIHLKKLQMRLFNEFLSFYKNKLKAKEYLETKQKYSPISDANANIIVGMELRIPHFIFQGYYNSSKIFCGDPKSVNKIELGKETKKNFSSASPANEKSNKKKSDLTLNNNLTDQHSSSEMSNFLNKSATYKKFCQELDCSHDKNYFYNNISILNVRPFSYFPNEDEVILNSGSLIIIDDVIKISENYYEIKSSLINFSFLGFCHILPQLSDVGYLNLSFNNLGKKELFTKNLNRVLQNFYNITEISLQDNNFGEGDEKAFNNLYKILLKMEKLAKLNLNNNSFGKSMPNTDILTSLLKRLNGTNITYLELSNNQFSSDNKVMSNLFLKALAKNTSIKKMNLSDNYFNKDKNSLITLNEYLIENKHIKELDLSKNCLGLDRVHAKMLAYALIASKSLKSVNLSFNFLGGASNTDNSSMSNFSELFIFNNVLEDIDLSNNEIGINSGNLEVLFKNLLMNSTLKRLDLSANKIASSEMNMKYLRNFLIKNTQVKEIFLKGNEFNNEYLPILISGLKKCKHYKLINLENNQVEKNEKFMRFISKAKNIKGFAEIKF